MSAPSAPSAPSSPAKKGQRLRQPGPPPRPTILPRAGVTNKVQAGKISTFHSPFVAKSGGRKTSNASEASYASEDSSAVSVESDMSERTSKMQEIDRKWFMRMSPISCLPAEEELKVTRRKFKQSADSYYEDGQTEAEGTLAVSGEAGEYLNFEKWGLSDDYLDALLGAHRRGCIDDLAGVRHVNLSENQLTERGIATLMKHSNPESFVTLNLSSNRFQGVRGGLKVVQLIGRCKHITELNLNGNAVGDSVVEELCNLLERQCPDLSGLGLARCNLGHTPRGGNALASLISMALQLNSLDLNWNLLHGEGAHAFLKALLDNSFAAGKLRRLSLAWNRLGSGAQRDPERRKDAQTSAKILASVFQEGSTLFHLDIGYNSINAEDCAVLAKGLENNHTLYGLHLVGNDATVDDLGFVVPLFRKPIPRPPGPSSPKPVAVEAETGVAAAAQKGGAEVGGDPDETVVEEAAQLPDVQLNEEDFLTEMNSYVQGVPSTFRLDHPADFTYAVVDGRVLQTHNAIGRKSLIGRLGRRSEFKMSLIPQGPVAEPLVLRSNPSMHSFQHGRDASFSKDDLGNERRWVQESSRVQTIADLSISDAEAVQRNAKCCWICENWVEHRISFIVHVGGSGIQPEEVESVFALYGVDGFTRPTRLRVQAATDTRIHYGEKHSAEKRGSISERKKSRRALQSMQKTLVHWTGIRMLPPTLTSLEVVFLVNGIIMATNDLPRKELKVPKTITVDVGDHSNPRTEAVSVVNLISVGRDAFKEQRGAIGQTAALCVLEDPLHQGQITVVPRMIGDSTKPKKAEWKFETSVFKDFLPDRSAKIEDCLAMDWANCRVAQIIKTPEARDMTYKYLQTKYMSIIVCYYCTAFTNFFAADTPAGMGVKELRSLFENFSVSVGKNKLIDNIHFSSNDIDIVFVASRVIERARKDDFKVLPTTRLSRFQFLEACVRTAFRRFLHVGDTGLQATLAPQMHVNAVEAFMEVTKIGEEFLELRKDFHNLLFTEVCCTSIREHTRLLQAIFESYRGVHNYPGRSNAKTISFGAWVALLQDAKVVDDNFSSKNLGLAFALGKELRPDDISSWRHMELSWTEFLVALSAVVRLSKDFVPEIFADLLDEFFDINMMEAHQNLSNGNARAPRKAVTEYAAMTEKVERAFKEIDESVRGTVSLKDLKRHLKKHTVRTELAKVKLSESEISLFIRLVEQQIHPRHGFVGDLSCEDVTSGFIRIKESMRGIEKAVMSIEKAFAEADTNSSGAIELDEFQRLIEDPAMVRKCVAIGLSLEDIELCYEQVGQLVDTTNLVMMVNILESLMRLRDPNCRGLTGVQFLGTKFSEADVDGSGGLSKEEVIECFGAVEVVQKLESLKLSIPNWEVLFEELDVDGSGELSWEEVCDGMTGFWLT